MAIERMARDLVGCLVVIYDLLEYYALSFGGHDAVGVSSAPYAILPVAFRKDTAGSRASCTLVVRVA